MTSEPNALPEAPGRLGGEHVASEGTSELGLTVSAVARRMGVAPATLRTWDRRYGVGPSEHTPGSHRRYGAADLARLEHMRRLVISGIPPADAAKAARDIDLSQSPLAPVTHLPAPVPAVADDTELAGRAGGGRVVALPGGGPAARGLARAAQSLDTVACSAIITESMEQHGVIATWERLIVPVMSGVGQQWTDTGRGIEVEHALSGAVQEALASRIRACAPPLSTRSILLACAPDEMHALVLWAVAAALAERGISARILGASLPAAALASAVRRLGPAVVFVWSQMSDTADPSVLGSLPSYRPAPTVLFGGPGWRMESDYELAPGMSQVKDLTETVDRIAHSVGG